MNRLEANFLNTKFINPIVVASGSLTETPEQVENFLNVGAGAVVPRSTRLHMIRKKHPSPHLYQTGKSMINSEWTGEDIEHWKPYLEKFSNEFPRVIMSISGRDINGCIEVCKILDTYKFPVFEINISCAASSGVHGQITRNIEVVKNTCKSIKDAGIKTPISIKLGHSDGIVEISAAAKEAGADAITAINTFGPVFDFDIDGSGNPKRIVGIENSKGGLSGSSIFHIALTDIAEISRQVKIPVMASGGVMEPKDAVKMIMAGASLVQLYTALHIQGANAEKILQQFNKGLAEYLDKHSISNIEDIKGKALPLLDMQTELEVKIPSIDGNRCCACKQCANVCIRKAIVIDKTAKIIKERCAGCGHCISVCKFKALF